MTSSVNRKSSLDYKDRKVGLVLFGILQIILGLFSALMVPLMLVSMSMVPPNQGYTTAMMIPGIIFYVFESVWFICMGIGSINSRRWARALILVSSWIWLIGGSSMLFFMLFFMRDMFAFKGAGGSIPSSVIIVIQFLTFGFMTVLYVLIPASLVFFYGSKHTKATCEHNDPQVRWTDKCPLPVLAVSLLSGVFAVSMLFNGALGWVTPFFGVFLSGFPGAIVILLYAIILVYISWGTYQLKIEAWWCAVLVSFLWGVSAVITFSRQGLMSFYEMMKFPPQQLEIMRQMIQGQNLWLMLGFGLVWFAMILLYLLYTKKYFVSK